MMRTILLLLLAAAPALAQDTGVQRSLIERQQATDAFNLQMRQSQEAVNAPPSARGALESRQYWDRHRLDALSEEQLRDVQARQTPPVLQPYERQKFDTERQPFRSPIVEVPVRPVPKPAPILPEREGIRLPEPR